ncbi:hypothetical protein MAR_013360 [Mya arenaria]|uniref:Temptin n=1 Tax=Mya arenaria TaxID=6604 RepID=A0ABY7G8T3_MYAAR|nr:hypothetical protein MAR_013360 [Mya arenaria]
MEPSGILCSNRDELSWNSYCSKWQKLIGKLIRVNIYSIITACISIKFCNALSEFIVVTMHTVEYFPFENNNKWIETGTSRFQSFEWFSSRLLNNVLMLGCNTNHDRREDTDGDGIPDGVPDFTGVPWCDINKFSKHCLGEEFENDDLLGWEWKGRSQPENCTLLTP